jgi:uncharacterized protein VirK/YbjX
VKERMMSDECPQVHYRLAQPYVDMGFKAAKEGKSTLYMKDVMGALFGQPAFRDYWKQGWVAGGGKLESQTKLEETTLLLEELDALWTRIGVINQRLQDLGVTKEPKP